MKMGVLKGITIQGVNTTYNSFYGRLETPLNDRGYVFFIQEPRREGDVWRVVVSRLDYWSTTVRDKRLIWYDGRHCEDLLEAVATLHYFINRYKGNEDGTTHS